MAFNNPTFAFKRTTGGLVGNVHETPTQNIQGGIANEHYHLTNNEHSFLQFMHLYDSELMVNSAGDILHVTDNDIIMGRILRVD